MHKQIIILQLTTKRPTQTASAYLIPPKFKWNFNYK